MPSIKRSYKFDKIKKKLKRRREERPHGIAVLVDGPNMLRKEFQIDLDEIRRILADFGEIKVGRVYLNQYASDKLVEAIENQGFEPMVGASDVDVRMAVDGTELILNDSIDTIALVTRDADFKPLLGKASFHGKETILFGAEPGLSAALKNVSDYVIVLKGERWEDATEEADEHDEHRQELPDLQRADD